MGFALVLRFCGVLGYGFIGGASFGGGTGNGVSFGDGNGGCDGRSGKGGGEGQEDKAEGEEEGGENAARFHLGNFLSFHAIYDAIKNALAVKSERKELIHDIHAGVQGQAALRWVAVRCFAALGFATGL